MESIATRCKEFTDDDDDTRRVITVTGEDVDDVY